MGKQFFIREDENGMEKHSLFERDRADGFAMVLKDYLNLENSEEHFFSVTAFLKKG